MEYLSFTLWMLCYPLFSTIGCYLMVKYHEVSPLKKCTSSNIGIVTLIDLIIYIYIGMLLWRSVTNP